MAELPEEGPTRSFGSRQRRVAAGILAVGFAAALVIYFTADSSTVPGGERPEDSKKYLRQMEVYGGTANVLASELRQWVEGLWHGNALAFTIACISGLLAAVAFIALTPLPSRVVGKSGELGGDGRDSSEGARRGGHAAG